MGFSWCFGALSLWFLSTTVEEVAKAVFKFYPDFNGSCDVYIGGLLSDGSPSLQVVRYDYKDRAEARIKPCKKNYYCWCWGKSGKRLLVEFGGSRVCERNEGGGGIIYGVSMHGQ